MDRPLVGKRPTFHQSKSGTRFYRILLLISLILGGIWLLLGYQRGEVEPLFLATTSNITLNIPPGGGIDRLTLTRRQVDGAGVSRLLGLTVSAAPQASDLDTLTRLLAAFGIER